MKKPIIIWIVAALFLFCSIPFFGQGSIVEGICGIAIAAALGVFWVSYDEKDASRRRS